MKKVKLLKKLIKRIEDYRDPYIRDAFEDGYDRGLDSAISVIKEKIVKRSGILMLTDFFGN